MYWNQQPSYVMDKPILRSSEFSSVEAILVQAADVFLNKEAAKVIPGGLWLSRVNGEGRLLPRVNVITEAAIGATEIEVDLQQVLKIGDPLKYLEKRADVTIGGTYVVGEYIYLTYDRGSIAYQVTDTAPADVATGFAAYINATPHYEVRAVANGTVVEIYSVLGGETSSSTNSDAGTVVSAPYVDLGFIGIITAINYETGAVTVDTPTTVLLPVGAKVGTPVDEIVGFHIHSVDFTYMPQCALNAIDCSDGVYTAAFPYLDADIKSRFPRINFT